MEGFWGSLGCEDQRCLFAYRKCVGPGAPFLEVYQLEVFTDPGASAQDNIDGALPVQSSLDGTELRTENLISPDSPYVITYSALDKAGNSAVLLQRKVRCYYHY